MTVRPLTILIMAICGVIAPTVPAAGQDAPNVGPVSLAEGSYAVFTGDGRPSSLGALLSALDSADVLLVGEEHGDLVGHALEAAVFERALDRYDDGSRWVVLSLEMFERDVQYVLDEYLSGLISETHFVESARAWEGYAERYRPLVELARTRSVPVVAANAPRRYVNRVTREGPESLRDLGALARYFLPPLPYPGPSARYRAQWDSIMAEQEHGGSMGENALWAQALWDASMGQAIVDALDAAPGRLVMHVAGSFHVERGTGIPERIESLRPGTRVLTAVFRHAGATDAWSEETHRGLGDFVVLTAAVRSDS